MPWPHPFAGLVPRSLPPRSLAVAILLPALLLPSACDRGSHPRQIARPAPDFTVVDGARRVELSSFRGRVVVLNFWATWCEPCVEEMPSLGEMQRRLPNVAVVGVSIDTDPDAYEQFLQDHHITFLTVRDAQQHSNALYGTARYPETYVIDREGLIRRKFIGAQDWTTPEILNYLSRL